MCGIAGALAFNSSRTADDMNRIALSMGDALAHRGPDEGNVWCDAEAGVAFAHRRLSIIDLSSAGRQPMHSCDGRFVLAYNGEIYNFPELRRELEESGARFRGHSDTEVMLEAIARRGLSDTLPRLVGMFAIALWDRRDRVLTLIRDRLGIKPLYWGQVGNNLIFASELKALMRHPDMRIQVNRHALDGMLRVNYIPGRQSILEGIEQLRPGHLVTVSADGVRSETCYWDAAAIARDRSAAATPVRDENALEQATELLSKAVGDRLVADVPLGAFLSGGIDSSTVVALMQAQSQTPVRTFSIGFEEGGFNEAPFARRIAEHLETEHHELIVSPQAALDVIPKLPEMYCEPFADSSQIPTHLVSVMAREHVTVALSGDGGDEIFAGYNRYVAAARAWHRIRGWPLGLRRVLACAMRSFPAHVYDAAFNLFPETYRPNQPADRADKIASLLGSRDLDEFHTTVIRIWRDTAGVVAGLSATAHDPLSMPDTGPDDSITRMQLRDILTYLPDDILTKVDRASMAVGLEARVPLIDHRVVEFMWSIPTTLKIRDGQSKWLLRRILDHHVPPSLMDRPKAGFAIPIGGWLRGPLRDWAEDLLSEHSLRNEGLFEPAPVRRKWVDHLSGRRSEQYALWSILMAQAWSRRWLHGAT